MIVPPLFGFQLLCGVANCYPTTPGVRVQPLWRSDSESEGQGQRSIKKSLKLQDLGSLNPPLVHTESGLVEGYIQQTIIGRPIAAFEAIPYAKPPVEKLRFQPLWDYVGLILMAFLAPVPADPWPGVLKGVRKAPSCLQLDFRQLFRVHGVEDCLYLNVYTPKIPISGLNSSERGLPVIFHVHGGGYMWWTGADFGPAYLLNKDVILVTSNHIGVMGFFSSGDSAASGNWGLKDQLLALKWVQFNIHNFGGDPKRVTITGMSTGAVSAALHVVSPKSHGLISGAICESGTATNEFSIINETFANSRLIARRMGCPHGVGDSHAMVSCLRGRDGNWIVAQLMYAWKELLMFKLPIGPVIESVDEPDAFLTEDPLQSYLKGEVNRVPIISGINRDEGAIFAATLFLTPLMLGKFNRDWDRMSAYTFGYDHGETPNPSQVSQKIKKFYLKGQNMNFWNRRDWVKIFGDRGTVVGNYDTLKLHSKVAPTYGYMITYEGPTLLAMMGFDAKYWGVSHADTTLYLYNSSTYDPLQYGTRDYVMSQFIVDLWTNFAATGVPSFTADDGERVEFWNAVQPQANNGETKNIKILEINQHTKMIEYPFQERIRFWKNLDLKKITPKYL